ncbi:hypothetical protein LshimejAT787_0104150 [Lyophyllum shimeji]|uniref:Uncharacterized protein n=1 Tax=Lyophyllum shimeji TaxID=47721 RepID=A0A9P3PCT1_LYOSH|nr:hypothetical protein LshimejAT787_0104150 [Lyophyllum shimeji]
MPTFSRPCCSFSRGAIANHDPRGLSVVTALLPAHDFIFWTVHTARIRHIISCPSKHFPPMYQASKHATIGCRASGINPASKRG